MDAAGRSVEVAGGTESMDSGGCVKRVSSAQGTARRDGPEQAGAHQADPDRPPLRSVLHGT